MTTYDQAVGTWTEHLRSGGTATWSAWMRESAGTQSAQPARSGPRPGRPTAAHLEVARLLNELAGTAQPGLVDLVLDTAPTGRGLVDPPLPWGEPPRFGSPPAQPDLLPTDALARVALPLLARLLPDVPAGGEDRHQGVPRPWRRRFRVHGSPVSATAVGAGLHAQGFPGSGRRATHLVVARPLELMMAEHWHARALQGGAAKWWRVWRRALSADALPRRLRSDTVAARLLATGRPVHVVVASDQVRLGRLVAEVAGRGITLPPGPDPAGTDLVRRLNPLLALTAGPDRVRPLVEALHRRLLPDAAGMLPPPEPLAVPPWARAWATERASAMAVELRRGGYAVHGDPDDLVPVDRPGSSGTVDRERTLRLALAAGVRAWQLQGGTR